MTLRVLHVTTGLELGGAEMVLWRLLAGTRAEAGAMVFSMQGRGRLTPRIEELGVEVVGGSGLFSGLPRLRQTVRSYRPDVIQTWMYHADLFGGGVARSTRMAPIVWGLHAGILDQAGVRARAAVQLGAGLSRIIPRRIICCSQTSFDVHRDRGYDAKRMVVVDNGFAPAIPRRDFPDTVRAELGLRPEAILITRPARYHPQKDFGTLLRAFERVHHAEPSTHLLLVGSNVDGGNGELMRMVNSLSSSSNIHLLGERDDMAALYSVSDFVVSSSSFGEALPLVIGEAMAAEIPVVATDVGDARRVIGDTGAVTPPGDHVALARAMLEMVQAGSGERVRRGAAARARIEERFSIDRMCRGYLSVYREAIDG